MTMLKNRSIRIKDKEEANVTEEMENNAQIIKSRFRMMGEGKIDQSDISHLSEASIRAFLTISDPDGWPSGIAHLKKYVAEETVA